jgi:hypothetical protein
MSQVVPNGVKPKAGRLATGSYFGTEKIPIKGDPFTRRSAGFQEQQHGSGLPGQTNVRMSNDRINGTVSTGHVIGTMRNTSTQPRIGTVSTQAGSNNTRAARNLTHGGRTGKNLILMPHEHGNFFLRKPQPIVKTQFGASKSDAADTSFHPIVKHVYNPPMNKTPVAGERTAATSFVSRNNNWFDANNSFVQGQPQVANNNRDGVGRWHTTKRGVVG